MDRAPHRRTATGRVAPGRARGWLLAVLVLGALAPGCAVAREEHRNVLEWLDAELAPGPAAARAALVPVALPVGLVGYVTDSFLVNPVRVADDAWYDTRALLWEPQADETTFRRVLLVPVAVIFTPPVWALSWVGRILMPIPSYEPDELDVPAEAPEPAEAAPATEGAP